MLLDPLADAIICICTLVGAREAFYPGIFCYLQCYSILLTQFFQLCHHAVGDTRRALGIEAVHHSFDQINLVPDGKVDEVCVNQDSVRWAQLRIVTKKQCGRGLISATAIKQDEGISFSPFLSFVHKGNGVNWGEMKTTQTHVRQQSTWYRQHVHMLDLWLFLLLPFVIVPETRSANVRTFEISKHPAVQRIQTTRTSGPWDSRGVSPRQIFSSFLIFPYYSIIAVDTYFLSSRYSLPQRKDEGKVKWVSPLLRW